MVTTPVLCSADDSIARHNELLLRKYKPCLIKRKHDFDIFANNAVRGVHVTRHLLFLFIVHICGPLECRVLHDDFHFYSIFLRCHSWQSEIKIKIWLFSFSGARCVCALLAPSTHTHTPTFAIKNNQNSSIECNSVVKHFHLTNVQRTRMICWKIRLSGIRIPCSSLSCFMFARKQATIIIIIGSILFETCIIHILYYFYAFLKKHNFIFPLLLSPSLSPSSFVECKW